MTDSISNKIRLISNRLRCSKCYSDSSDAVFVVGETVRFKLPIEVNSSYKSSFTGKHNKMIINKSYELESAESLIMVCTKCGTCRKTTIPRGFGKGVF